MIADLFIFAISTEAAVNLILHGSILQPARAAAIRWTPWLKDSDGDHLLECGFCMSVWGAVAMLMLWSACPAWRWLSISLAIHRISNYLHNLADAVVEWKINQRLQR